MPDAPTLARDEPAGSVVVEATVVRVDAGQKMQPGANSGGNGPAGPALRGARRSGT
ncbi:MAG TPA: hypothetical protein VFS43_15770 [Polyangiaceae bacterium]|nr:hypothetical protein [Polyangiaceae bacterium]